LNTSILAVSTTARLAHVQTRRLRNNRVRAWFRRPTFPGRQPVCR